MNNIIFSCDIENLSVSAEHIIEILPNWKTKITNVEGNIENLKLNFLINAKTKEEIKEWLEQYQDKASCTYSVDSSNNVKGKYLNFKQRLRCQHNTRCKRLYNPLVKGKTKNTNCPSTITVKLRAFGKRKYQGKDKSLAPDPEMPCSVILLPSHNHQIDTSRFRRVSEETKEKLIELFKNGHTAATALTNLKLDICMNYPDCSEKFLADRKYSADYNYCHYLYTNFIKTYVPKDDNIWKDSLIKWIDDFNRTTKENCIEAFFSESQYVICICPPLIRRTHRFAKASSEVVYMDSTGTVDRKGNRVFLLLTYSECGALPLAIIITSSEEVPVLVKGFQILKEMLGDDLFGGNINGPNILLIDESASEQAAIEAVWPNSECFLSNFHILQSVWRWLIDSEHCINMEDLQKLFINFKEVVYAESSEECERKYEIAKSNATMYPNYLKYLDENYWQRKELWALYYRSNKLSDNTHNYCDATMHLLIDKIFDQTKLNDLTHLVDYLSTKFIDYFKMRLLDAADNRLPNNVFGPLVKMPPSGLIEKIQILSGGIYLVPSEKNNDLFYIVNSEVLICTCTESKTGRLCKHLHWICFKIYSEEFNKPINDTYTRKQLYLIAKGEASPQDLLLPSLDISTTNITNSSNENSTEVEEKYVKIEINDNISESNDNVDTEEIIQENNNLIQSISSCLQKYARESPLDLNNGLTQMLKNLLSLRTTSACALACTRFAKSFQRKGNQNKKMRVQSIAISKRKANRDNSGKQRKRKMYED